MEKRYTTGKAALLLGCNKSLLRYYEKEFNLLIPRSSSNRRIYTQKEIDIFKNIEELKEKGYCNAEIKGMFNSTRIESFSFNEDNVVDEVISGEQLGKTDVGLMDLFNMIAQLRDELSTLKDGSFKNENQELINENNKLKDKLKEKTYELVSLREKLITANKTKRKFFK